MRNHGSAAIPVCVVALALATATSPTAAQTTPEGSPEEGTAQPAAARSSSRDARRLFQRFAEDDAIIPSGWVEGQFVYTNLPDSGTRQFIGGLFAFRVTDQSEAGLRLGWANMDANDEPNGSGLADIDIYGKYRFHGGAGHCALGGLVKAATADEEKGLGTGATDVEGFGACRADLKAATVAGNVGLRYNGATSSPLPDAEASVLLGGALLVPSGSRATVVIEATYESERLKGEGSDVRLTLGLQWTPPAPGFGFRGAVALPLSDGAPDSEIIFGAVWQY